MMQRIQLISTIRGWQKRVGGLKGWVIKKFYKFYKSCLNKDIQNIEYQLKSLNLWLQLSMNPSAACNISIIYVQFPGQSSSNGIRFYWFYIYAVIPIPLFSPGPPPTTLRPPLRTISHPLCRYVQKLETQRARSAIRLPKFPMMTTTWNEKNFFACRLCKRARFKNRRANRIRNFIWFISILMMTMMLVVVSPSANVLGWSIQLRLQPAFDSLLHQRRKNSREHM